MKPGTLGRRAAVTVFVAVLSCVPVIEWWGGARPGVGVGDGWTVRDVTDGRLGAAVEQQLQRRSVVAGSVRPYYNAAMFRLFRETTRSVVLGRQDWLFLASTVRGYPPPRAAILLDETAELIEGLCRWFEGQGTTVFLLVVPNKATMYPGKLADQRPRFEPYYGEIHAALDARALWTVDLRTTLDPANPAPLVSRPDQAGGETYHPFDSHWTPPAAVRAAEAVNALVETQLAGIPRAFVGAIEIGESGEFIGGGNYDLLDIGGDSGLRERFRDRSTSLIGVEEESGRQLGSEEPQALVWVGTSFSRGYHSASHFSALAGREVEDASLYGEGPTRSILSLADAVRREEREPPALIVWEFPERYFFNSPAQMQEPLRQFLGALEFSPESAVPVDFVDREVERLAVEADDAEGLVGSTDPADPTVTWTLGAPLQADRSHAFVVEVTASRVALARVFFDLGDGFGDEIVSVTLPRRGVPLRLLVPIEAEGPVHAIRLEVVTRRRNAPGQDVTMRVAVPELWAR